MEVSIKQIIQKEFKDFIQAEMQVVEQRIINFMEQEMVDSIIPFIEKILGSIMEMEKKVEKNKQFNLDLEERLKALEKENEEIKENFNSIVGQIDLIQINQMEKALRLRGIPEEGGERLIEVSSRVLAQLINAQPRDILLQIEKIYRVNSQVAIQNNLPRDIVVYFSNKGLRDEIVQVSYNRDIHLQNRKVCVFKEIPFNILRQRKQYYFLTNELRNRQIRYRWEFPHGLSLIYEGKKYFLNTRQKAEDFYKDVLIVGNLIRPDPEQVEKLPLLDAQKDVKEDGKTLISVKEDNKKASPPGRRAKKATKQRRGEEGKVR